MTKLVFQSLSVHLSGNTILLWGLQRSVTISFHGRLVSLLAAGQPFDYCPLMLFAWELFIYSCLFPCGVNSWEALALKESIPLTICSFCGWVGIFERLKMGAESRSWTRCGLLSSFRVIKVVFWPIYHYCGYYPMASKCRQKRSESTHSPNRSTYISYLSCKLLLLFSPLIHYRIIAFCVPSMVLCLPQNSLYSTEIL